MDSLVVENLGKCYILSRDREDRQSSTFRERLGIAKDSEGDEEKSREFWALRDVSFRVQPGTIMGVGRVVSLLELGAGFDPDMRATDNILMNAAMLGIPKHEAQRRIPEIFEFAGVEKFERMALKHYSSGMFLRLAFSVAINMNPQILLADEILAVGDQVFQERCLQRIAEGARDGLTVLFVSHDMEAIMRICNRVMWINAGQ